MSEEDVELVLETLRSFESSDFEGATRFGIRTAGSRVQRAGPNQVPSWVELPPSVSFVGSLLTGGRTRISKVNVIADRGGRIVLAFRWEARGEKSGVGTALDFAAAYRVEDRQISEAHFRWTREEALEAAGLSE